MLTLSSPELAFLSVVGRPELTIKALRLYAKDTLLFSEAFFPHLNTMWNAYVQLLKKAKKEGTGRPSADIIAAALAESVQSDSRIVNDIRVRCDTILQRLTEGKLPPDEEGIKLMSLLAQRDSNRKLMEKINSNADLAELQRALDVSRQAQEEIDDSSDQDSNQPGIVFHPFRDIDKLVVHTPRIPTGINWLDETSSGGGREGELWLILGAPGGGKTAMCVQYSCAQALLGNNVLWATFEQTLEGDIAERMVANITDTSLDQIRDRGFANLDPGIKDRFMRAVSGVDDRLTALDMTRLKPDPSDPEDYGGILSVWKQLKKLKENGIIVKTVILDWFGAMMSRIAANTGLDLAACYRFKAQEEINILIQMAKQENVLVIVFHQLDSKAADARPTYLANATHAQDMHNMQNFFDLVFTIGIRDVNNVCWFSSAKSRKGNRISKTLRLIGDKSRFVMEDGWLPNSDGNFYRPGATGPDGGKSSVADYSRELE